MKNDFEMIVKKLGTDLEYINIYPVADVHIGSQECDETLFKEWVDMVKEDQNGYVVIAGDMMNMGLRNSKTNVYEEKYSPSEQKERLFELLEPIKEKILACVGGNHCERANKEAGQHPLYDVMCMLGQKDAYRKNACFLKVSLGTRAAGTRQHTYTIVVHHGGSKAKREKWLNSIDGADILITGHTHTLSQTAPCKTVIDAKNNKVRTVELTDVVCSSFQQYGGYAISGMYTPQASRRFQTIRLDGKKKRVGYTHE